MRFRQNSDLFYLTGVNQEESILVLCPDFPDKKYREVLFLRETSELIAVWEGHITLSKQDAQGSDRYRDHSCGLRIFHKCSIP